MIEHLGIVEAVQDGKTTISVATGGCRSCHKESECGIGQVAGGRAVTRLTLPAPTATATSPPMAKWPSAALSNIITGGSR